MTHLQGGRKREEEEKNEGDKGEIITRAVRGIIK